MILFLLNLSPAVEVSSLPSLHVDVHELRKAVGYELGYTRDSTRWTTSQVEEIDGVIDSGLRQFYSPPLIPGQTSQHEWTFLRPTGTFTTWAAVADYLPIIELYVSANRTTITVLDDTFTSDMVGKTIAMESGTEYEIIEFVSATEVVVVGTFPTTLYISDSVGTATYSSSTEKTTITGGGTYSASHVGYYIYFASTENSYEITDVDSATQLKVSGDASAESGAFIIVERFSIAHNGNFNLPPDFGGIDGKMVFGPDGDYGQIPHRSETQIILARQEESVARPRMFSYRPKSFSGAAELQYELMLYPEPDAAYVLQFRYHVLPRRLTDGNPFPHGCSMHGETIIESCLAVAEHRIKGERGLHWGQFLDRVAASIMQDRQTMAPQHLGPNLDYSDVSGVDRRRDWRRFYGRSTGAYVGDG